MVISGNAPVSRRAVLRGPAAIAAVGGLAAAASTAPAVAATWHNPAVGTITSGYRPPDRPDHPGTDVANSQGTPIRAAAAGTVTAIRTGSYPGDPASGPHPGRTGNCVIVDHGSGVRTYYGHLHTVGVAVGRQVAAGEHVATMGTTGNSTGPHLHFEVLVDGVDTNPVPYLAARGVTLGTDSGGGGGGAGWPSVVEGVRSETARSAQHLLNAHGHGLLVDGWFGATSAAAARAFQSARGLVADGSVGPQTWPRLVVATRRGSSGHAVRAAQVALNQHGAGLPVDGDFGAVTESAARDFQQARGLVVDGLLGVVTWERLV
ncbi:MAG TPA: peptidoglycan DD-metalloendopeptidase family protein [Nocardioides sp.]